MAASQQEYCAPSDGTVLYKYRHLDGEHRDWTKRIITDAEVYFATAKSFNDPWDSRLRLRVGSDRQKQAEKFDSVLRRRRQHLSEEQRRTAVERMLLGAEDPQQIANFERRLQDRIYTLGIYSLSEDPSNILLWGHYANSHMGVCLGFSGRCPFFQRAIRVSYQDEYAQRDPFSNLSEKLLTTKARDWQYERERRIVDPKGSGGRTYPQEALRLVILGCRLPKEDKESVTSWIHQCDHSIDLVQAEPSNAAFRLAFTKIQ